MTFKKFAKVLAVAVAAVICLPVIVLAQILSVVCWWLGTNHSTNKVTIQPNGVKTIEVSGVASRLVAHAFKIGGMGFIDMSMSPAIAIPTKGYIVFRTDVCMKYAHMTQCFVGSHELGHLLDPAAKKPFGGLNINNEFTADAHAVKALLLTPVQVKEIFDDLYSVSTVNMPTKARQQIKDTLMLRRDRAIKVAEELLETA